jgi:hypothetical protein
LGFIMPVVYQNKYTPFSATAVCARVHPLVIFQFYPARMKTSRAGAS